MSQTKGKIIDHFYGGIIRDEKTRIDGAALNVEELDIFENANFVRAAQVMTRVATSSSSPSSSPSATGTASPTASPSASPSSSASSSPSGEPNILEQNLISYWALDETSGVRYDAHGNNDLSVGGSLSYATGKQSNAADFEKATNDYLAISDASQSGLDITGDLSWSMWIKPESVTSGALLSKWNDTTGTQRAYLFELNGALDGVTAYISQDGGGSYSSASVSFTALTPGSWYHLAGVYDASAGSFQLYLNGADEGTSTGLQTSIYNSPTGFELGAYNYGGTVKSPFDGLMDEVSIWNRTLSASDASALYNGGAGLTYTDFTGSSPSSSPSSSASSSPSSSVSSSPSNSTSSSPSSSPSNSPSSSPSASSFPQDQTEITAYTGDLNDNAWGYGGAPSTDAAYIYKLTNAGSDTPGAFELVQISADTTNDAFPQSPLQYHKTTEANAIYYLKKNSTSIYLVRYDIDNDTEDRWTGSAWSETGALDASTQLTGLTGTNDRYFMRVEFGELYIGNGNYISKVDSEGTFTEKAFQLPLEWEAVDITFVSDVGLILARNINRKANFCKAFWWDLTSEVQFDNQITIPHGGPQWIVNFKERLYVLCAQNGVATFYSSVASPGVPLQKVPGMELANLAAETETQEISSPKMMAIKDGILYFGLYKTDKTGVYAIGSLDEDKPTALILAKRFDTTDYSRHVPIALHTQGPNFYASYEDNGAFKHARCESNNSPDRSSNAIYESVIFDEGDPTKNKDLMGMYVMTKPLASGTGVDAWVKTDYNSWTQVYQEDSTNFATTNKLLGNFRGKSITGKTHQFKFQLTSNGTDSPIVTGLAYVVRTSDLPAYG